MSMIFLFITTIVYGQNIHFKNAHIQHVQFFLYTLPPILYILAASWQSWAGLLAPLSMAANCGVYTACFFASLTEQKRPEYFVDKFTLGPDGQHFGDYSGTE